MSIARFESMPEDARVWIHSADKTLLSSEQSIIQDALDLFVQGWSSHGRKVIAETTIVGARFVVIAAHIPGGDISGCGIDACVNRLDQIGRELGFGWASTLDIFYNEGGSVRQVDRSTFAELVSDGKVTLDTVVYDTSVSDMIAWRSGRFEQQARESWHNRAFRFAVEAT